MGIDDKRVVSAAECRDAAAPKQRRRLAVLLVVFLPLSAVRSCQVHHSHEVMNVVLVRAPASHGVGQHARTQHPERILAEFLRRLEIFSPFILIRTSEAHISNVVEIVSALAPQFEKQFLYYLVALLSSVDHGYSVCKACLSDVRESARICFVHVVKNVLPHNRMHATLISFLLRRTFFRLRLKLKEQFALCEFFPHLAWFLGELRLITSLIARGPLLLL